MENTQTTEATGGEVKPGAPANEPRLANIVRGQIPLLLVKMIRFDEKGNKEAEIAKKYGTTGGKVADILKGRNFSYITEDFAPTQEQKDAAIAWLRQVPDYDKVGADAAVSLVDATKVASAEQAEAFQKARSSSRTRNPRPAGEAQGEGSGQKAPKKAKGEAAAPSKDAVDKLLA